MIQIHGRGHLEKKWFQRKMKHSRIAKKPESVEGIKILELGIMGKIYRNLARVIKNEGEKIGPWN